MNAFGDATMALAFFVLIAALAARSSFADVVRNRRPSVVDDA